MTAPAGAIAAAFITACRDELEAPKPGNVHVFADGHRMSVADFMRSADAAAGPLTEIRARVGQRILGAIAATRAAVGTNTNLGIILLSAAGAARGGDASTRRSLDVNQIYGIHPASGHCSPRQASWPRRRHDIHAVAAVT